MNTDVIDCNVLHFKDNWVCLTRRPGRVCLRRAPTALGSDVVCSTNWTGLSLNRQRRAARVDRALAVTLTRRRISLLSSVRRRRRRGFPEGSPSRPPAFCVGRISLLGVFLHRECGIVEGEKVQLRINSL